MKEKKKEKKPEELFLDRASFIAWTEGVLLSFKNGRGVVGDHVDHERVEPVLKAGGRVFLTVRGKPVTEVVVTKRGFVERELKEGA